MNEKYAVAAAPQVEQPILDWQPSLSLVFLHRAHKRGQVVEDKQTHALQVLLNLILARDACEVWQAVNLQVWRDNSEIVQRMAYISSGDQVGNSFVKRRKGHLAVHEKNLAGRGSLPLQKRVSGGARYGNAKRDKRLSDASLRVQLREALRRKEWVQQHLAL